MNLTRPWRAMRLLFGFGISGRTLEEFAAMIEATEAALAKAPR